MNMINKPTNWNEVKEFSDRQKLPLSAYICKVKKTAIQSTEYGAQLCVLFDIVEGDFKGYFDNDFKANQNQDKKWKGVLRQWLPKDNGTEKDEWTKSSFKGMVTAFEKSNPGYQFDWNEASLVGKLIGILFRNEEWEYEGKTGWAVRPFKAISVDSVRSGEFTIPKDKPLKKVDSGYSYGTDSGFSGYDAPQFADLEDDDGELPF
jgi:hypothetical protein